MITPLKDRTLSVKQKMKIVFYLSVTLYGQYILEHWNVDITYNITETSLKKNVSAYRTSGELNQDLSLASGMFANVLTYHWSAFLTLYYILLENGTFDVWICQFVTCHQNLWETLAGSIRRSILVTCTKGTGVISFE